MARIGGKSIGLYILTTVFAISIGLLVANLLQPGSSLSVEASSQLLNANSGKVESALNRTVEFSPLNFLVNLVPSNPFASLSGANMLHIVFFAVFFGLVLSTLPEEKRTPVLQFFDGMSDVMITMVTVVMYTAPIGVFALMASTIAGFGFEVLTTLLTYSFAVAFALVLHAVVVYGSLITIIGKYPLGKFLSIARRVQILAFSTSSSAASLPVTLDCAEKIGVSKKISSFVIPLGATINMDGTSLYQGVAAVFIAQVYGMDLSLSTQLTIVLTATLASIGTAPVPGVGLIMLIIVLQAAGIPEEGIALILGVDRILDMLRTSVNVTGDLTVATCIAQTEQALIKP
jgi:Na+/H+-dicarboxylate symporter